MSVEMESPAGELDIQTELDETVRALREITLMIEQSQVEVSKFPAECGNYHSLATGPEPIG